MAFRDVMVHSPVEPRQSMPLGVASCHENVRELQKMNFRKERLSLGRDAVMGGNDLPLAANLHPYVGQPVVIFVGLTFGFAFLVIGAGDNGRVAVETDF